MPLTEQERLRYSLAVNIIGGLLVGYVIGYVPVATTIHGYLGNCTRYTGEEACIKETHLCKWSAVYDDSSKFYCDFKNGPKQTTEVPAGCSSISHEYIVNVSDADLKGKCKGHDMCLWNPQSNVCEQVPEWPAWMQGFYAGMMIIGGMVGSFGATPLLDFIGRKKVIGLTALSGVIGVAVLIIGWQVDTEKDKVGSYWIMVFGRLVVGIAVGLASVVCPMYCGEMAPAKSASAVGCTFQVAVTFGIFFVALLGYVIELGVTTDPSAQPEYKHLKELFHIVNGINLIFPLVLLPVAMWIAEPDKGAANTVNATGGASHSEDDSENAGLLDGYQVPLRNLARNFFVAVALASAQQLTGINAVMNYAPKITSNFGLRPLQGNMIVMLWNFVTTIGSIPIASRFPAGQMYVASATIASLACLLTAIPVFPSVSPPDSKAGYALTGVGVFVFVAAFELGMGPAFYVLAQSIFPASRRSFGCSFTVVVQFIFNLIVNFCFPVAVVQLSGGADGDQRQGMGWVFVFFGVVGLLCTSLLGINLYCVSKEREEEEIIEYE